MSLIPIGTSVALAAAAGLIGPVFSRFRAIGDMTADVTVEEHHVDETEITNHPVEYGAAITDHAYDLPRAVTITAAWSNSSLASGGDPNYVQSIYAAFLALKSSRVPFSIITGKCSYSDMLIHRITERTDRHWENAMLLVIECRQVILVETQTVTVPPNSVMANPKSNGASQNLGTISLNDSATGFNLGAAQLSGLH